MSLVNLCHWSIYVIGQFMSLVNLCHWSIYVVGQFMSLVNLCRWSIYIIGQFISLVNLCHSLSTIIFLFKLEKMNERSKEIFERVKSIQKGNRREREKTHKS